MFGMFDSVAFSTASGIAVAANASVEVRKEVDGSLATIYKDADGNEAQPNGGDSFKADSDGYFRFYAAGLADGYKITVTFGSETRTLRNVPIGTSRYHDAGTVGSSVMLAETQAEARSALGLGGLATLDEAWAPQCGRLTLVSGTPVTSIDQSAKTTIYFTPYKGNLIALYDGENWVRHAFSELSQALSDSTKSPAAAASSSVYDLFVWDDDGTLRLSRGPAWSSATSRGTGSGTSELELFQGRHVNKEDITNGPEARLGLYVGSIYVNGSTQVNDSVAARHVWNCFNRVVREMRVVEATDSWSYSTATLRQANNSAGNQLDFVVGLSEDAVRASVVARAGSSGATAREVDVDVGVDSTSVGSAQIKASYSITNAQSQIVRAEYQGRPGIGRHTTGMAGARWRGGHADLVRGCWRHPPPARDLWGAQGMIAQKLHEAVASVCPIHGVSVGRRLDKKTWRIDFKPEATAQQRAAAQAVVDAFDPVAADAPLDLSDVNNLDRALKALAMTFAEITGTPIATVRTIFKQKWQSLGFSVEKRGDRDVL